MSKLELYRFWRFSEKPLPKQRISGAWQESNARLYDHLTHTAKELPNTLDEMAPLFAAVAHGCAAGRHQEALDEVYWRRILRGNEFFLLHKLGAYGVDLTALQSFFTTPWREPLADLTAADQAVILNQAGADLRALGRLSEAAQPMQASLAISISQEDWKNAAQAAGNLSELYLTLGELPQARVVAQQSVELADRSGDLFQRMNERVKLADALHQSGQLIDADIAFRAAEALQKERRHVYPLLFSWQGFRYCDLLLGQGQALEVRTRVEQTLEWGEQHEFLLDIALDNLALEHRSSIPK